MTQSSLITNVKASGEEIYQLVNTIEMALEGASKAAAVIACISIALGIQYPEISAEDRVEGVHDISKYICLWIDSRINPSEDEVIN